LSSIDMMRTGVTMIGLVGATETAVSAKIAFQKYPGYTGPYNVETLPSTGDATIWSNGVVTLQYAINGVPVSCEKPSDKANSCGIHIHEGKTCDNASKVGGHYFDSTAMSSDPWASVVYTAKRIDGSPTPEIGEAQGFTSVTIGSQTQTDIVGRAMVIHGPDGERIGCGIIGTPSELHAHVSAKIPFQKYPGYDGPYDVNTKGLPSTGDATIWSNGIVTLQYYINGVPVSCSKPSDKANSCGIHIHEGKRCDDASKVGGHYFDSTAMSSDPWANVVYTATEIPGSPTPEIGQAQGYTSVTIGSQTQTDIVGRAMVIHGPDGERIGCGLIGTASGAIEV